MGRKRVLIVEDELITAIDIKEALEKDDFEVTDIVRTGEKALIQVKKNKPDAIIMDIQLAGEITGLETAQEIATGNGIPIVFLTANESLEVSKEIVALNNVIILSKPLRTRDLVSNLNILLKESAGHESTKFNEKLSDVVYVPVKNGHQKLHNNDFLFAEASGSYVTIFTREKPIVVSTNLGNLHKQIGNHIFIRISRKHIVNIHFIDKIENHTLVIDGKPFAVGEFYRNDVFKKLQIIKTK
jgi:DNA-binding LytR/AlgR family response regulator